MHAAVVKLASLATLQPSTMYSGVSKVVQSPTEPHFFGCRVVRRSIASGKSGKTANWKLRRLLDSSPFQPLLMTAGVLQLKGARPSWLESCCNLLSTSFLHTARLRLCKRDFSSVAVTSHLECGSHFCSCNQLCHASDPREQLGQASIEHACTRAANPTSSARSRFCMQRIQGAHEAALV